MKTWIPALLFGVCLLPAPAVCAGPARVTWSEFAARVKPGCAIRMALPDGTQIEGRLLAVRADSMDLDVKKTSNKQAHPKGAATLERRSVRVVEVRPGRWKGRLIGTVAPLAAGGAMLAAAAIGSDESAFY